jgi:peptidyl-dipeptidase Dcp
MDAIANNPEAPTFENTIVQMEKSGLTLERVRTIYEIWGSNMSSNEFQSVETEMEPKLAGLSDKIYQNEKLFKRIEAVFNSPQLKTKTSQYVHIKKDLVEKQSH